MGDHCLSHQCECSSGLAALLLDAADIIFRVRIQRRETRARKARAAVENVGKAFEAMVIRIEDVLDHVLTHLGEVVHQAAQVNVLGSQPLLFLFVAFAYPHVLPAERDSILPFPILAQRPVDTAVDARATAHREIRHHTIREHRLDEAVKALNPGDIVNLHICHQIAVQKRDQVKKDGIFVPIRR